MNTKSILVEIRLKESENGGRPGPFNEGYSPHLRVNGSGEWLGVRLINHKNWIYPGETVIVEFELMYFPDVDYCELRTGVEFSIVEGVKEIGYGKVVEWRLIE